MNATDKYRKAVTVEHWHNGDNVDGDKEKEEKVSNAHFICVETLKFIAITDAKLMLTETMEAKPRGTDNKCSLNSFF